MASTIYEDGDFVVTDAVIATRRRLYPIANTTATIRRDPLWAAISLTGFGAASLLVYGDLLYAPEMVSVIGICAIGLVVGRAYSILRLDALGHRRAFILARTGRIEKLFSALKLAQAPDRSSELRSISE